MITKYELNRIADEHYRNMLKAFNASISKIRDAAVIKDIENLIAKGNIDRVIDLLQLDRSAFTELEETIRQAYISGGETGAKQIGKIPLTDGSLVARFNTSSPTAQSWLANESSRFVTDIVQQQREVIRTILSETLSRGDNPRRAALDLVGRVGANKKRVGGYIGLTNNQAGWVSNARMELDNLDFNYFTRQLRDKRFDSSIRKAMEAGTAVPQKTLDGAITNMQNRALRYRGEVIARSESLTALGSGQWESVVQASQASDSQAETKKVWDSTGDSRTRPDHAAAEGQERALSEPFLIGGYEMMYPRDSSMGAPLSQVIQCRCQTNYQVSWGKIAKKLDGFG